MKNTFEYLGAVAVCCLLSMAGPVELRAAETDFSCVSHEVRSKIQVAERYKEYDVILQNACPGPVYWSMCIERMDPLSHEVLEVHTPSGYLEADNRARVNLQMKKGPERMTFRHRYQEFYVNIGYAINAAASAACAAKGCEAERRDLRTRLDANVTAWEKAEKELAAQLARECPQSGWDKTQEVDTCEAGIREGVSAELEQYAATDAELRAQLQEEGLERCRVHGGDLAM
ncbi:MAG: hypothetical protein ACSLE2_06680 [Lysobacterales bacterium]